MKSQYDLTKTFELKGDWFLPEAPKRRLSGEVSFSPEEGIHLELIGDFQMNPLGMERNSYATILGVVEGSREISLFRCMYSGRREVSLVKGHEIAKPVITFSVGTMIDGWFFGSYEEVRATDLYLQIDGLAEWLCTTGFKMDAMKYDYQAKTADVHYELPKPIEFDFSKGVKASFLFSMNNSTDSPVTTKFTMEQTVCLRLQNEDGFSIDDILRESYKFLTFLTLGLNGETFIKSVYFYNPIYAVDMGVGEPYKSKIELFYHQHYTVKVNKWDFREMTFTYPAVKNDFQKVISRWDEIFSDFEPAINLLIEQIRDKGSFSDNDFLNLAQASETIHDRMFPGAVKMPKEEYASIKKNILNSVPADYKDMVQGLLQYGNNVSLSQRLSGLVEMCPKAIVDLFIPDTNAFVNEIRDSRNYYTHYTALGKKSVKRHGELYLLSKRIQELLIVDLLLFIGMSEDMLVRQYQNQEYKLRYLLDK